MREEELERERESERQSKAIKINTCVNVIDV